MASGTSEGYQAWVKHRRDCVVCCSTINIRCDAESALRDKFLKEYKARERTKLQSNRSASGLAAESGDDDSA